VAKNVLIVENYLPMRRALENLCSELGFETVFVAECGQQALAILKQQTIDVIVADNSIEDMTGIDVLQFARQHRLNMPPPMVLLTEDTSKDYVSAALAAGVSVVMAKPFSSKQFKHKLALLVEEVFGQQLSGGNSLLPCEQGAAPVAEQKSTILIVDDEASNIELASNLLKDSYKVKAAKRGDKALQLAQTADIDLVLLDIMMPEMDGYEVCRQLKANPQTADIPVIFLTAKQDISDVIQGFSLGAVDYITKPLQPEILQARVKTHVSLRRSHLMLEQQVNTLQEVAKLREDIEKLTHHDLKGPLGVILFELYKIKDQSVAAAIEESVTNVLNMINNSLDVFKIENGNYPLNPVRVDLDLLLNKAAASVGRLCQQKNIRIEITGKEQGLAILGEELLCMAVFNNLVKNAVEASPEDEVVSICCQKLAADQVEFTVTNKGVIPDNLRENLFDKYATSNHIRGSGLGTYSAKLMTEAQHGSIAFNILDEQATCFQVILPAAG
jgi:CheY-like chemotaxis protein